MKILLVVMACAGCASAKKGPGDDDSPRASHEVVSGGGRIKGGTMRMDVSIGHVFAQRTATGSGASVKTASPVAK